MNKRVLHQLKSCAIMVAGGFLLGLSYEIFIFPNAFAPAGLNGLATMLQYLLHISIGFFSFFINLPLLVLSWRHLDREYALHTLLFVLVFAVSTLVMNQLDMSRFIYHTENGTSAILGPVAAGLINGAIYSVVLRYNGSTGGTDIIAALIRKVHPEASLMWLIFALNAIVAGLSYFVYDFKIEPVILCLIYCYLSSKISDSLMKRGKYALKFEVITEYAEELSELLLKELHHGVTVLPARGMYSGSDKDLLICVVNRYQIVSFHEILARFPSTFAYVSDVNETMGNFQKAAHEAHRAHPRTER